MSANALPVITVHGHASNPGTVTELTVYERALERSLSPQACPPTLECWWTATAVGRLSAA